MDVAAVPYPELLAYAQSLSAFTSAPPNMPDMTKPGQPHPPLFFPPFPNEEKMRRGRLNAEAPLGHLGETHSVGRRGHYLPRIPLSVLIYSQPLHNPLRLSSISPSNLAKRPVTHTDNLVGGNLFQPSTLAWISMMTRTCEYGVQHMYKNMLFPVRLQLVDY